MIFYPTNISHKPYGIVGYRLYYPMKTMRIFKNDIVPLPIWTYTGSSYYLTKKAQRMAYFDLSKKYPDSKFIAFADTKRHPVEIYGEQFKL